MVAEMRMPLPETQYYKPRLPQILHTDSWRQVVDKYEDCCDANYQRQQWPAEIRIMEMVLDTKKMLRLRAFLACADLNMDKEIVAEFRRKYALMRKPEEGTKTSKETKTELEATDDAPPSPASHDFI